MAVTLQTVPAPAIGEDAHSISSLTNMLAVMNSNFNALKAELDSQEATLTGQATEYLSNTVPNEAVQGDKWYKTDNADPELTTTLNAYVCKQTYVIADGLTTNQKEQRFQLARDVDTLNAVTVLEGNLDGKTTTFQSNDPPAAAGTGDTWIDINPGEENGAYTVIAAYDYSANTPFTSPTGTSDWTAPELASHFRLSGSKEALQLAQTADAKVDLSRTNYLRAVMPGLNGAPDAGLTFEVGDSWTEDSAPAYQSHVCYVSYSTTDVPADTGLHPQFLLDHWREKGDKTGRDAATAAQATADGKIENFRQETVPQDADLLDTWYKDSPTLTGQAELYVNTLAYTTAFIDANFASEGFASADLYRLSLWEQVLDQDAVARANSASALASTKTTDFYLNDPPSGPVVIGDKWIDKDASPIRTYVCKLGFDFSASSPVWSSTGTDVGPATPSIPVYWDLTDDESSSDTALLAKSFVDTKRTTYAGVTPPESSGVSGLDIEFGDTWVKMTTDPSTPAVDPITGIAYYSSWLCYRSYTSVAGIGFTGSGYSGDFVNGSYDSGVGTPLPDTDANFNAFNAYNYWKLTEDPNASEFAVDLAALQDKARLTYQSNSLVAAQLHGHSEGIPDASTAQGGINVGDIWIDEANDLFQVRKCIRRYAYDDADPGNFFISIAVNWLDISEPLIQAQAIFKKSVVDGKRAIYVTSSVPNPGGPSNWNLLEGARIGDVWINNGVSPAAKYWCKVAYVSGGILATNWEGLDQVPTPATPGSTANKQYVDDTVATLVDSAPATLDTLNELAAALGDDPNFATTIAGTIGTAQSTANTALTNAATAQSTADGNTTNKVAKSGDTMSGSLTVNVNSGRVNVQPTADGANDGGFSVLNAAGTTPYCSLTASHNVDYWIATARHTLIAMSMQNKLVVNVADAVNPTDAANLRTITQTMGTRKPVLGHGTNTTTMTSTDHDFAILGGELDATGALWSLKINVAVAGGGITTTGVADFIYNSGGMSGHCHAARMHSVGETFSATTATNAVTMDVASGGHNVVLTVTIVDSDTLRVNTVVNGGAITELRLNVNI